MLILVSDSFDASLPGRLSRFGEVTDDKSRLAEAQVVLIRSKTKCTREYIDKAPCLKMIIRGGVGLDNVDRAYAKSKGIAVHNTPEASSIAVAEMAMGLMLGAINRLPDGHAGLAQGKWLKSEIKRTELYKKTLGLIGIGRIGAEVATRARGFGMQVIAHDRYVSSSDAGKLVDLTALLAEADIISLHTPLTEETREMINAERISAMKRGVGIVNTARAECVDAAALASALQAEQVGWYATDVWPSDPPAEDYPLLQAPRVLKAPHIGGSTKENLLRIGDLIEQRIAALGAQGV